MMKPVGWAFLLLATVCSAQESRDFRPASTNVWGVFYESPGTDHEWQTWRRSLKDFAPRLFR